MYLAVICACLTLSSPTWATTVGEHSSEGGFCYSDLEGCGPNTAAWPPLCHTGRLQSPISLPPFPPVQGSTPFRVSAYRGSYFRMQNNGHSVQIDFDGQAPSNELFTFPDPLMLHGPDPAWHGQRQYKFAAAHFHWGVSDFTTGSEHCIGDRCSAMEIHLVHYLASYPTMAAAVASGDPNALTVVGVLIDMNPFEGMGAGTAGTGPLKPIVDNLPLISLADNDTTKFTLINAPLDLTDLLMGGGLNVYTYKGSLTTPGCNEQVNWFVFQRPAGTSHQDLEAFRSILRDERGITLRENHRPLQADNGRPILLANIFPQ